MTTDKLELISIDFLNQHRELATELSAMNKRLALSEGWHYILDWTWVVHQIGSANNKTILDAGAGIGLLQWYLASKGANVISVDRSDRTNIPFHLIKYFTVEGLTPADKPLSLLGLLNFFNKKAHVSTRIKSIARGILGELKQANRIPANGTVKLYGKDLGRLTDIPDNSIDFVVSISALEHNKSIDDIKNIAYELHRVLRPGGKMIITLPAAQFTDWFFEPAYSWCFTDSTIKDIFHLANNVDSNYEIYNNIFEDIKNSKELRKNISWRYYFTPNSGMPNGHWNPQYIPVGVVKTKPLSF